MAGLFHAHTPARRDAAVRRLRTVNRSLVGLAVITGAVITDVAANAFPGRTIKSVAARAATGTGTGTGSTASVTTAKHRRQRTHESVAALTPPASPPASVASTDLPATSAGSSGSSGGSSGSSAGSSVVAPAAPAPVVSGGS